MPTYEYRCPAGHDFEHFVLRMSEASGTMACPTCGKIAERKISAGGGLLFKGSGFYITDYGKDGKKDQRDKTAAAGTKAETAKDGAGSASKDAGASAAPESSSGGASGDKPAKSAKAADAKPAGPAPSPSKGSTDA